MIWRCLGFIEQSWSGIWPPHTAVQENASLGDGVIHVVEMSGCDSPGGGSGAEWCPPHLFLGYDRDTPTGETQIYVEDGDDILTTHHELEMPFWETPGDLDVYGWPADANPDPTLGGEAIVPFIMKGGTKISIKPHDDGNTRGLRGSEATKHTQEIVE